MATLTFLDQARGRIQKFVSKTAASEDCISRRLGQAVEVIIALNRWPLRQPTRTDPQTLSGVGDHTEKYLTAWNRRKAFHQEAWRSILIPSELHLGSILGSIKIVLRG